MTFSFTIPQPSGEELEIALNAGSSLMFVGANGSGKTRLAASIERKAGETAHRIAAHRALNLNPKVAKVSESQALRSLRYGGADDNLDIRHREGRRWGQKSATYLLNDFDYLLQALFAEQTNTALETHKNSRKGRHEEAKLTKFEKLQEIWETLLPHRKLNITGDDIKVSATDTAPYNANEMSDGERSIFYLIGQTLVAAPNSLLIVDEPELHVHRSIIGSLWDELEAARDDCGFVFITHDIEFASSRDAEKFSIKSYSSAPAWEMEKVPSETGFGEELTTLILGSRNPVLFVEGDKSSLDVSLYRHCIPNRTIVPAGSCEQVIHSVVSLRNHAQLTRIACTGLIDADDRTEDDIDSLESRGVQVLPVSEIENILLLPIVSKQIAICNGYTEQEADEKVAHLNSKILQFVSADNNINEVVLCYCRRRIDRSLKKVDLNGSNDVNELETEFRRKTESLDIAGIASSFEEKLRSALNAGDVPGVLALYDNKGLLSLAASILAERKIGTFKQWVGRLLRNGQNRNLVDVISQVLPEIR